MKAAILVIPVLLVACSPQDRKATPTEEASRPKFDPYQHWLWQRAEMITLLAAKHEIPRDDAIKMAWAYYTDHDAFGRAFSSGSISKQSPLTPESQTKAGLSAYDTIQKLSKAFDIEPKRLAAFISDARSYDEILSIEIQ